MQYDYLLDISQSQCTNTKQIIHNFLSGIPYRNGLYNVEQKLYDGIRKALVDIDEENCDNDEIKQKLVVVTQECTNDEIITFVVRI